MQKIPYEQHIKILGKDSIHRDGVWVEKVKIFFILITKVWDISPPPPPYILCQKQVPPSTHPSPGLLEDEVWNRFS